MNDTGVLGLLILGPKRARRLVQGSLEVVVRDPFAAQGKTIGRSSSRRSSCRD
jgi:hypothetical protein